MRSTRSKIQEAGIVLTFVSILFFFACHIYGFFFHRGIEKILENARTATNIKDMSRFMDQLITGMEKNGMTEGHATVIFKTPHNNMKLIYGRVIKINEDLIAVKEKIDPSDVAYQVALNDLRDRLGYFDLCAYGWFWANNWIPITVIFLFFLIEIISYMIIYKDEF